MSTQTNSQNLGTSQPSHGASAAARPAAGTSILLLEPRLCHPAPGNRTPTMELVAAHLLPSIGDIGQQVPGIVRPHPSLAEGYEVLAGNLRCYCCGILNIQFKAVQVETALSEAGIIKTRLTENVVREAMSLFELADDLARFQQLEACTQAELAEKLHLSEAMISRVMRLSKQLAPDLRPLVDNFTVRPSVAFLIASLPTHDLQREAMKRAEGMKRDAVASMVARMKGKKPKAQRAAKGKTPGGMVWGFGGTPEAMQAELDKLGKALKTLIANKWDLNLLGNVLKG